MADKTERPQADSGDDNRAQRQRDAPPDAVADGENSIVEDSDRADGLGSTANGVTAPWPAVAAWSRKAPTSAPSAVFPRAAAASCCHREPRLWRAAPPRPALPGWKVAIVDDDQGVHTGTRFVLQDFTLHGRPLDLYSARSVAEAREQTDVPIILFSYFNPLLQFGVKKADETSALPAATSAFPAFEKLAREAQAAGPPCRRGQGVRALGRAVTGRRAEERATSRLPTRYTARSTRV